MAEGVGEEDEAVLEAGGGFRAEGVAEGVVFTLNHDGSDADRAKQSRFAGGKRIVSPLARQRTRRLPGAMATRPDRPPNKSVFFDICKFWRDFF